MQTLDKVIKGNYCPDSDTLLAYGSGQLSSELVEPVGSHVSVCPVCQSALEELAASESSLILKVRNFLHDDTPIPSNSGESKGSSFVVDLDEETAARESVIRRSAYDNLSSAGLLQPQNRRVLPGGFELQERIGKGGMGVVYTARDLQLNRTVAVKLVNMLLCDAAILARFHTEAAAAARLEHENIVRVYTFGQYEDGPYLVMEYVTGGNLEEKIENASLTQREAASLVKELARAVSYAHSQNVIHRDLKPANVLLTADGTPKLTDFGLAKLLDSEIQQTVDSSILGTASYMAPEQARGDSKAISQATDVYGLGAILYETLTGRAPFKSGSRMLTLDLVRTAKPALPSSIHRGLNRDLEAICLKCLEKDPKNRYPSADDLAADLDRWLRGRPTKARPLGLVGRLFRPAFRRPIISTLGLLFFAVSSTLAAVYWPQDPDKPRKQVEAGIQSGRVTTLIGESGPPKWSYWRVGGEKAQSSLTSDGVFSIHSWDDDALLELAQHAPAGGFRLRAEVRHEKGFGYAQVGIYCCYAEDRVNNATIQKYINIPFNDVEDALVTWRGISDIIKKTNAPLPPPPKGNQVGIHSHIRTVTDAGKSLVFTNKQLGDSIFFESAKLNQSSWRSLVIEITQDNVGGSFDGQSFNPVLISKCAEMKDLLAENQLHSEQSNLLPVSGGIGLYLCNGSASFRSVTIEPLR